jgi:hypothetical protein
MQQQIQQQKQHVQQQMHVQQMNACPYRPEDPVANFRNHAGQQRLRAFRTRLTATHAYSTTGRNATELRKNAGAAWRVTSV